MNLDMKKRAWELAAQMLDSVLDDSGPVDQPKLVAGYTQTEDDELREYMREHICEILKIVASRCDESMRIVTGNSIVVRVTDGRGGR